MAFGAIIQQIKATANGVTSVGATFPSTPTDGNLIVAVHMTGAANSSGCSSSGGSGGAFTSALAITNATESDESEVYYRIAGATEPTLVTATSGASDENAILLIEIEGPWEASPLDLAEAEARQASGTSYAMATANSTSQNDEVAVAVVYTRSSANGGASAGSLTWSNSFVNDEVMSNEVTSNKSISCATKLLTATGTVSTTFGFVSDAPAMGGIVTFKKQGAGGGTVTTTTLTSNIVVSDGPTIFSTIYGLLFGDDIAITDQAVQSRVRSRVEGSAVALNDAAVFGAIRNRLLSSNIVITDSLLSSVVGNNILTRVLSSSLSVTDGALFSILRNRLLQDTIIVSEGEAEQYTTTNIVVDDEIAVTDEYLTRLIWRRVLGDSIGITDEALAVLVGENVITKVLTSNIETFDEALRWLNRYRTGESVVLTTDETVKVMRFTRELTDAIETADEPLTAMQRFILLTDVLSVDDSASASINPTPDDFVTPTIRIGFDQPRIDIGGYSVN